MAGLLDSLTSMVTPELAAKLGKGLGMDPGLVGKGFGAIGPVVLGSLARTASSPEGSASLLNALPQAPGDNNWLTGIVGMLSGGGSGGPAGVVEKFLGPGSSAIGSTLTQKLGFDVRPLMTLAVPVITGLLAKTVKARGASANELSQMLLSENDAFMKNPANKETAGLVFSALAAGDKAKALRDSYDEAEWLKVRMGPTAALYHIASATHPGPAGLLKEFSAASDAVSEATRDAPDVSLIGAAFGGGLQHEDFERLSNDHPSSEVLLADLRVSYMTVSRKNPGDAQAYRNMVLGAAQRAAEACKEGGFLGIGGTRVSDDERRALDDIRRAMS